MRAGAILFGAAGLMAAAPATAATPLVLQRGDAPGMKPARATLAGARNAVAQAIRPARLPVLRGEVQVARFTRPRGELWSVSQVLRSTKEAQAYMSRALKALRRRGIHSRSVPLGTQGLIVGPLRGRSTVVALWRRNEAVGQIVLRLPEEAEPLRRLTRAYARVVDARMRHVLGLDDWQRTLEQVRPDGTMPRQTALDLFALTYGPLPGVKAPRVRKPGGREEGTLAGRALLRIWSTLNAAQRSAAMQKLGFTRVSVKRVPRRKAQPAPCPPTSPPPTYGDSTFAPEPRLQALAERLKDALEEKLGIRFGYCLVAGDTRQSFAAADGTPAAGDAWAIEPDGSLNARGSICRIRVTPGSRRYFFQDGGFITAHEVFHCFAAQIDPDGHRYGDWAWEGLAEWAAIRVVGRVPYRSVRDTLGAYFRSCSTRELFSRTYDGVAFFGHADDVVGDLWPMVSGILRAGNNSAAYESAGAASPIFLNSWASSALLKPFGPDWYQSSPTHIPESEWCPATPIFTTSSVGANALTTASYEISDETVDPERPLLHIRAGPFARLGNGEIDTTDLGDAWFCLVETCACPEGQVGDPPPAPRLGLPAYLALTGHTTGAAGQLKLVPLSNYCRDREPPPPPPRDRRLSGGGCRTGCGSSFGDPHLVTLDGRFYDFHGAGEFTLVRSRQDGLEVQAREEPVPGVPWLANNTAIAMRVDGDRVVITRGAPLVVRANGRGFIPEPGFRRLPRGGRLRTVGSKGVEVLWSDGSLARVYPIADAAGISVLIRPALSRRGTLHGLLGNFDGSADNDFVTRSGLSLKPGRVIDSYRLLYRVFGESWRITQRQSLFDYGPGQSTRTFTNRAFPKNIDTLKTVRPLTRRQAERHCRRMGIRSPALFRACVIDVAGSGDNGYATAAGQIERVAGTFGKPPRSRGGVVTSEATRWTAVAAGETSGGIVPSVQVDGGKVVAAYATAPGVAESVTFTPSVAGDAQGVRRETMVSGWATFFASPLLLPRPSGGLQALLSGFHSAVPSDPLNGTSLLVRGPDGRWGAPAPVTKDSRSWVGSAGALAPDGSPIWPNALGSGLYLWRGATNPAMSDLRPAIPRGQHLTAAVGRDGLGRYWVAWYAATSSAAERGLYMLQFDPNTLQPVGRPQRAPGSALFSLGPRVGFACARLCRLVYRQELSSAASWSFGERAATTVTGLPRGSVLDRVTAAYTKGGRLWVSWVDTRTGTFSAKLGDASGAGGRPVAIGRPAGTGSAAGHPGVAVVGDRLVVILNWGRRGGYTRYVNVVRSS